VPRLKPVVNSEIIFTEFSNLLLISMHVEDIHVQFEILKFVMCKYNSTVI
jgi:hypothetical protein